MKEIVHASIQIGDRFYIYLEYVYPGSINKYVREHFGVITESVVRNFTRHILNGLAYLHSRKTMHRFLSLYFPPELSQLGIYRYLANLGLATGILREQIYSSTRRAW